MKAKSKVGSSTTSMWLSHGNPFPRVCSLRIRACFTTPRLVELFPFSKVLIDYIIANVSNVLVFSTQLSFPFSWKKDGVGIKALFYRYCQVEKRIKHSALAWISLKKLHFQKLTLIVDDFVSKSTQLWQKVLLRTKNAISGTYSYVFYFNVSLPFNFFMIC